MAHTKADEKEDRWYAAQRRKQLKYLVTLQAMDTYIEDLPDHGIEVTRIAVKVQPAEYQRYLVILSATVGDVKSVAFAGGGAIVETLAGMFQRVIEGDVEWKEDRYAEEDD